MVSMNNQTPFPCSKREQYFPGLGGRIFHPQVFVPSLQNAFCIYAGNSSTFIETLKFVEEYSGPKYKYRFCTLGLQIPYLESRNTKQGYPMIEEKAALVEIRRDEPKSGNVFKMFFQCSIGKL